MKWTVISFCVAFIPRCDKECNELKMALRKFFEMNGQGVLVNASQSIITSAFAAGTGLSTKNEFLFVNSCS